MAKKRKPVVVTETAPEWIVGQRADDGRMRYLQSIKPVLSWTANPDKAMRFAWQWSATMQAAGMEGKTVVVPFPSREV